MPANIDTYVGRKAAWHQLGIVTDRMLSPGEARKLAFDWEPVELPVHVGGVPLADYKAIARSDNGVVLSVVNESYGVLGNQILTDLATATGLDVETAGALGNGEQVWMLLDMGEKDFGQGEVNKRYLWMANGHDGSTSLIGRPTNVRVVCQNTWNAAMSGRTANQVSIRHSRWAVNYVDEARRVLAETHDQFVMMDEAIEALLGKKISAPRKFFIEKTIPHVFGPRPDAEGPKMTRWDNRAELLVETFDSPTQDTIRTTAYGQVMAINEWELFVKPTRQTATSHERQARRVLDGLPDTRRAMALVR